MNFNLPRADDEPRVAEAIFLQLDLIIWPSRERRHTTGGIRAADLATRVVCLKRDLDIPDGHLL
jgi:hypothetical protein